MRLAYLVNQYPKVSHSFIRREILALERQGIEVERIAVRGWDAELADEADRRERERTRYLLRDGLGPLVQAAGRVLRADAGRFGRALALAGGMGWHADRPLPVHGVYLAQACQLLQWLRESGVTHLHAHFGTNPAEVAMLTHALGGPPWSFTVHGPEEFDRPVALHLGEKLRRAAFAVAVSSYGRSQLCRWVEHGHWHKLHVVHCGLDPEFLAAPTLLPPAVPRLVCVGRLCEQKGQLLLMQAAARLMQRGVDFELVLAGDGEMHGDVQALIDTLGLAGRVRITGWISGADVREQILGARALVLGSFAEGLPVAIMEAMALRRPVIATMVAGIPELVRDGEHGWLVPAGDVEALAAAMQACLQLEPDTLARMGEAARRRVLERHDVDAEAARLATLFGHPGPAAVVPARAA